MAKPEWGVKRACLSCGGRFYDLRKSPIVCPSCGTTFEPEATLRARRVQRTATEKKPAAAAEAAPKAEAEDLVDADTTDVDVEVDDDDEAVIEDTSDLGGDDDDVPAVVATDDEDDK